MEEGKDEARDDGGRKLKKGNKKDVRKTNKEEKEREADTNRKGVLEKRSLRRGEKE